MTRTNREMVQIFFLPSSDLLILLLLISVFWSLAIDGFISPFLHRCNISLLLSSMLKLTFERFCSRCMNFTTTAAAFLFLTL
uniref:Uncharacterized protein n=1 Tax=Manihot esculenta TaxID=3983 RepID=A0A2C9V2M5_MANES